MAPHAAWSQSAVWQPAGATTGSFYYLNGNVGIGTPSPVGPLDLYANSNSVARLLYIRNSSAGNGAFSLMHLGNNVLNNGGEIAIASSANTGYGGGGDLIVLANTGDLALRTTSARPITFRTNSVEAMRILSGGNVGIGTTSPGTYKLAVEGTIGARDIVVTGTPWSDYVFHPGYRLRPLREVRAYIQAHRHLPGIPSEAEVKEKGVSVGDMQAKLLAKIEELTLHMIQAEDRNNRLEQRNRDLEDRLARLEGAVAR
jgi:hypothetical protein